jgi:sugar O-acyltransferase (sialic acid O-acetyltransferase NeuD family)
VNKVFGLFGAGGFAKEAIFLAGSALDEKFGSRKNVELLIVVRDCEELTAPSSLLGVPVVTETAFLALDAERWYNIAIANSKIRERISAQIGGVATPLTLFDSSARRLGPSDIAPGAIVCPFSMVSADTRIGKFFHLNYYSYVAHECSIGDFVTFAPGVKCNGNVSIGDHVYVGSGAVIRNGRPDIPLTIGKGAVIGMGAVVTSSVPEHTVVAGNPARPLDRR